MPNPRIYHGSRLRTGRVSEVGRAYVVTMVTRKRLPIFVDWRKGCSCARVLHGFPAVAPVSSFAWVIMPDHVHWLFSLGEGRLAEVVRRFKTYCARRVNAIDRTGGSIWQAGYHDHAVRREEDLRAIARYVVANPVRAGLCERVGDYPFWDAVWLQDAAGAGKAEDLLLPG